MASCFYLSKLVMSLLMFLALFAVSTTAARDLQQNGIKDDVKISVNQVCSLTKSPSYCSGVLNHMPDVTSEDLYNVANEILDQGSLKSEDILNKLNLKLLPKATSAAQKAHLQYCKKRYTDAYYGFGVASKMLLSKDYIELNKQATTIATAGNDCEDSFRSSPSAPSPLTQTNSDFFNLVDILAAASYLLSHP
ncbi:hypothetical protein MKX01_004585 [Papaver californicum]|nr:hypothetical protein MKX01_004585 [Papaver californicum]